MDLDKLFEQVRREINDPLTVLFHQFNESIIKDMPVERRPVDQKWNDHWKEYLERKMWEDMLDTNVLSAAIQQKPPGLK